MAKKHGLAKIVLGVGAAAVAGKVAFDKFKQTKERFAKEENDSFDDEIRKYNAIGEKKVIEVEDEVFAGCELKAVASKAVLDLGLAVFEKDIYINFSSNASVPAPSAQKTASTSITTGSMARPLWEVASANSL